MVLLWSSWAGFYLTAALGVFLQSPQKPALIAGWARSCEVAREWLTTDNKQTGHLRRLTEEDGEREGGGTTALQVVAHHGLKC